MNFSVKNKLFANALLAAAMILAVGAAGFLGIVRLDDAMGETVGNAKALRHQMQADIGHDSLRAEVYAAFFEGLLGSAGAQEKYEFMVRDRGAAMLKSLDDARATAPPEAKALIEQATPDTRRYVELANEMVKLAFTDVGGARQKLPEFLAEFARLEEKLEAVSDRIEKANERTLAQGEGTGRFARIAIAIVCAVAVVALLAISWFIARGILGPLGRALEVSAAVASGDLTVRIHAKSGDEFGQLLRALEKMRSDLAESVGAIQSAAENVKTGSREIARGNADLSSRTEEQASSLEETASSMEELTATVKRNTDNAHEANRLAAGASEVAARGGRTMRGVVETMGGISEASRRIADIVAVIDGIAFQTNILALNAAVEAARAGEQGRGFAVVASEVRALAQRSAASAREIKALIEESVGRVGQGTRLVEDAGRTMEEIVTSVRQVTEIVSEIASASAEQLRGIEQVSRAVTQMDQVVQQNAALVEESAAAAENLASQSEVTAATVGRFRLDRAEHALAAPAAGEASGARERSPVAAAADRPELPPAPRRVAARATERTGNQDDAWQEF